MTILHDSRRQIVLIVSPTHAEGELITSAVRSQLKQEGMLAAEEREFVRLVPKQWTAAEKGNLKQYLGDEILLFHHNTSTFKAGQRVSAHEAMANLAEAKPEHFSVYDAECIGLSVGDTIRLTGGGKRSMVAINSIMEPPIKSPVLRKRVTSYFPIGGLLLRTLAN